MSIAAQQPSPLHHVVIIGGGFGGVRAAKRLARKRVRITLVDRTNHHLFQPLLYQVATGILSAGQIAPALRSMFRRQHNVDVVLADAESIDVTRQVVHCVSEHAFELDYDTLIVAAGSTHSYFGHDEWQDIAPGMKTLDDATRIRSRILAAFELADQATTPEEQRAYLTFVVVGAGPTGVELAGQIAVLARRILRREYRHIDTCDTKIILADGAPHVLGPFDPKLQQRAHRDLTKLGVTVKLNALAVAINEHGIDLRCGDDIDHIDSKTVLWAAGVQASPLAEQLALASGVDVDRLGRLPVEPDCSVPGHPNVFVIGDMAAIDGVPGVAQPAIQEGVFVAKVISARLAERTPPREFRYRDKGSMATIGRTHAVAEVGRLRIGGLPAFLLWGVVHLAYLVGWGSRWEAVVRWMWTLIARNRRERLISRR